MGKLPPSQVSNQQQQVWRVGFLYHFIKIIVYLVWKCRFIVLRNQSSESGAGPRCLHFNKSFLHSSVWELLVWVLLPLDKEPWQFLKNEPKQNVLCLFSIQLRTKSVHWLIGTSNHFFINALSFCMYCYHFKENTTSILNVEKLILCLYWLHWNLQVVWIVDFFTTKNSVYHLVFLEIIGLFIASFVDFLANMKW